MGILINNSLEEVPGWDAPNATGVCAVVLADNQPRQRGRLHCFTVTEIPFAHQDVFSPSGMWVVSQHWGTSLSMSCVL